MLAGGVGEEGHWGGWECRTLRDAGSGEGDVRWMGDDVGGWHLSEVFVPDISLRLIIDGLVLYV